MQCQLLVKVKGNFIYPLDANLRISVVIPCLNEAETLEVCIQKALSTLRSSGAGGEVIVADNGSTDESVELVERCGACVVPVFETQAIYSDRRWFGEEYEHEPVGKRDCAQAFIERRKHPAPLDEALPRTEIIDSVECHRRFGQAVVTIEHSN